ncbi:TIGR03086 family metal-binding protein [uncultured Pseudokineococcus sp.]|uniref:TIGR03086 family metal-binding protein n=1 Tax=uncultured Pseudokineococcus sp. TaxID=1642928 RepID=UPI0026039331|nr:TIGR03086 family metal-binding protein [uncultured Pseudokineococcus sp.]
MSQDAAESTGGAADPAAAPLSATGPTARGPVDPAAAPLSATATTSRGAVDPAAAPLVATSGDERTPASASARALLPDALRGFTAAVDAAARHDGWGLPTPSSGWDVRAVVGHVAAQHGRVPALLGRGPSRLAPDGDPLGPDPRPTWRALVAASTVAWATAPEDARVVIAGEDAPASELAERLLLDLVVHAWDVRRALAVAGADVDERLDTACAEHCLGWVRSHQRLLADSGRFGTPQDTESADPQAQLLGLVGRRA